MSVFLHGPRPDFLSPLEVYYFLECIQSFHMWPFRTCSGSGTKQRLYVVKGRYLEKYINLDIHKLPLFHRYVKWPFSPSAMKIDYRGSGTTSTNTLRPSQNGRHFPDDTLKRISLNENVWISIKISLKFVPKRPVYNIPALVQIMAWRRPCDKPLSEPMMDSLPTHICVTRPHWAIID